MRQDEQSTQSYPLRWLAVLVGVLGIGVSLVLLWEYHGVMANPDHASFCDISQTFSCTALAKSGYASIGGVPIAWFGVVAFFVVTFMAVSTYWVDLRSVLFLLSTGGVLGSIALFAVSKVAVGALCPLCCVVYVLWIVLALVFLRWVRADGAVAAWSAGFRTMGGFPRALALSMQGGAGPTAALLGTLLTVFVGMATYSLPLMVDFRRKSEPLDSFLNSTIAEWRASPEQTIPIASSGEAPDFVRGPSDAPVQMVEFADFECPACQAIYPKIEGLLETYGQSIRYSLRNFPLDNSCNRLMQQPMHRHACRLAIAARCAGIQGKFWGAAQAMYAVGLQFGMNPQAPADDELLRSPLLALGIDEMKLKACIESGSQQVAIDRDIDAAESLGLTGTPAFWINGRKVPRATIEIISAIVRSIIQAHP